MTNKLDGLNETTKWHLLVEAAKTALVESGYSIERVPGRGLSNIWNITKGGVTKNAALRTTRDRWFAFPPLNGGAKWKTLDDVDVVVVATVNSKEEPEYIEVYLFEAPEVRKRFDLAYAARTKHGSVKDNFGMWVGLDVDKRGIASSVGSGIVEGKKSLAVFDISNLLASANMEPSEGEIEAAAEEAPEPTTGHLTTIGEVMSWARQRVADLSGVPVEKVKLDLKLEY